MAGTAASRASSDPGTSMPSPGLSVATMSPPTAFCLPRARAPWPSRPSLSGKTEGSAAGVSLHQGKKIFSQTVLTQNIQGGSATRKLSFLTSKYVVSSSDLTGQQGSYRVGERSTVGSIVENVSIMRPPLCTVTPQREGRGNRTFNGTCPHPAWVSHSLLQYQPNMRHVYNGK